MTCSWALSPASGVDLASGEDAGAQEARAAPGPGSRAPLCSRVQRPCRRSDSEGLPQKALGRPSKGMSLEWKPVCLCKGPVAGPGGARRGCLEEHSRSRRWQTPPRGAGVPQAPGSSSLGQGRRADGTADGSEEQIVVGRRR